MRYGLLRGRSVSDADGDIGGVFGGLFVSIFLFIHFSDCLGVWERGGAEEKKWWDEDRKKMIRGFVIG